ncbi:TPA: hypothetical protein HA265_02705 [Candidatus Woesearchaeota archaeon]|nr:hypothetical protein [Candidatus Woesearchaeota archaeon]
MQTFPFIQLEGKDYPTVIMGEDKFTGWFSKDKFETEEERANAYRGCLETAYSLGVRGFSMSPHETLIKVLKRFKRENQDVACISNHHWQTNYYVGKESLWEEKNLKRLARSVADINGCQQDHKWLKGNEEAFAKEDIKNIRLDEKEYSESVLRFKDFCDFALVGNIGISALAILEREDIIKKEIKIVRKEGMIPLGMCEGGGALDVIEKLGVAGTWVWINRHEAFPDLDTALEKLKYANKPVTAYRVFQSPEGFDIAKSVNFIKDIPTIKTIVVGVENKEQAKETFSKLHDFWPQKRR